MLNALTIKPKFSKQKPKIDQSSDVQYDEADTDLEDSSSEYWFWMHLAKHEAIIVYE